MDIVLVLPDESSSTMWIYYWTAYLKAVKMVNFSNMFFTISKKFNCLWYIKCHYIQSYLIFFKQLHNTQFHGFSTIYLQSSTDGHLSYLNLTTITNDAMINKFVHTSIAH